MGSGEAVLQFVLGAKPQVKPRAVPFIAIVDPNNRLSTFSRHLEDVEQGPGGDFDFDRVREILTTAETHIRAGTTPPAEPGWLQRKLKRWFAI